MYAIQKFRSKGMLTRPIIQIGYMPASDVTFFPVYLPRDDISILGNGSCIESKIVCTGIVEARKTNISYLKYRIIRRYWEEYNADPSRERMRHKIRIQLGVL